MVSVCLPSDALSQHLPSYLGFSYLGRGVSLHGRPSWPWTWSSSSQPSCASTATAPVSRRIFKYNKYSLIVEFYISHQLMLWKYKIYTQKDRTCIFSSNLCDIFLILFQPLPWKLYVAIDSLWQSVLSYSVMSDSDPMDCSPPGSSVHGVLQVRMDCHSLLQGISLTYGLNPCLLCLLSW